MPGRELREPAFSPETLGTPQSAHCLMISITHVPGTGKIYIRYLRALDLGLAKLYWDLVILTLARQHPCEC